MFLIKCLRVVYRPVPIVLVEYWKVFSLEYQKVAKKNCQKLINKVATSAKFLIFLYKR